MISIPQIAHRGMAIANMEGVLMGNDAFHRAAIRAEYQIVIRKVQLFDSKWIQRKEMTMNSPCSREAL
jgi:hypothetical protein